MYLFESSLPHIYKVLFLCIESSVSEGGREIDEKEATCYLFAVGELCRLSPVHTSSHLTLMVHSLLLATREGDGGTQGEREGGGGGGGGKSGCERGREREKGRVGVRYKERGEGGGGGREWV